VDQRQHHGEKLFIGKCAATRHEIPLAFASNVNDHSFIYKRRQLEQFQEKCEAVFLPELRENKELNPGAYGVKAVLAWRMEK
jgi:hypothetical protein